MVGVSAVTVPGEVHAVVLPVVTPQPLVRIAAPFDDPGWVSELKYDGFRALTYVEADACRLVSRHGHIYRQFPALRDALARDLRRADAVLDGEVVCLDAAGRPRFNQLLFGRGTPVFAAFFEMARDGIGKAAVAKRLNADGAVCPRAQQGRPSAWSPSSVNELLSRPLYRGEIVWNQSRKRD
jgi:hypothetical protein